MESHFFIGDKEPMNKTGRNKKVVVLGEHPLLPSILQQYNAMGSEVCHLKNINDNFDINSYDELFILTNDHDSSSVEADNEVISLLNKCAFGYDKESHNGHKLLCHLLLQSNTSLRILQMTDFNEEIRQSIDVYPFTMEDLWSKSIMVDYEPITIQSEKRAHVVIFGMNDMGEMVAINAAHKAHFPNFVRNHTLCTRITIVDDNITSKYEQFTLKHQHLFDNSYYRVVNPGHNPMVEIFHTPMYESSRECFVDVEWEFVEASIYNKTLRQKLSHWATDSHRLLSLIITYDNDGYNIDCASQLPDEIYSNHIPIHIYQHDATLLENTCQIEKFASTRPFGMLSHGYDVRLPHVAMAKTINHIYDQFYNDNHAHMTEDDWQMQYAVEIDVDAKEKSWTKLSNAKRQSSILNALSLPSKMRSIGLGIDDWNKFYDISQQEIELLAQVEHNRWNVEELILGFRPCTNEEQKIIENDISMKDVMKRQQKVHYDIRAYNDLRPDATGKSVTIYDICLCASLPLIAKSWADEFHIEAPNAKGGAK